MTLGSDAYVEPPRVIRFKGEIILSGPGCNAAYTKEAARALCTALAEALREPRATVGDLPGRRSA